MKTILPVAVYVAASLLTLVAFGQDSRSSSSSDRRYSEEEIKSRLERIDGYLKQLDKNGNGVLDADEVTGDQRRMADYLFSHAEIEFKVPIAIAQLRQGAENHYRSRAANATPPGMSSMMLPFGISTTPAANNSGPQVYTFAGGALSTPVWGSAYRRWGKRPPPPRPRRRKPRPATCHRPSRAVRRIRGWEHSRSSTRKPSNASATWPPP
jgi:hypothetical protein